MQLRFGQKLRLYLDMKALKVADAAEMSGLSHRQMEELISAEHVPGADKIVKVMAGLGIVFRPDDFDRSDLP